MADRPLSEKQRRFVEAYMGEAAGNATRAAELAGYSPKTAYAIGAENLRKPQITSAIAAIVQSDPLVATRTQRQQLWTAIAFDRSVYESIKGVTPVVSIADRLKASELLGRSHADFIERREHTGPNGGPIEFRAVRVTHELHD